MLDRSVNPSEATRAGLAKPGIAFAGRRLAKLLATQLLAEECERCGVSVGEDEAVVGDDGTVLCEGCVR